MTRTDTVVWLQSALIHTTKSNPSEETPLCSVHVPWHPPPLYHAGHCALLRQSVGLQPSPSVRLRPRRMNQIQSYAIDTEVKLSSDRKTRGVSDTFNRPGAERRWMPCTSPVCSPTSAGVRQQADFPQQQPAQPHTGTGWRGGNPEGLHYGAAVAREWFTSRAGSMPPRASMSR